MPKEPPPSPRIARIVTRLNIGGPSIQATRLTTSLEGHGYRTRLIHGRLGADEGDMSYLLASDADVRFVQSLGRPVAPLDDLRALVRLFQELRALRPHIVHTHMAKAGLLGRLAATAYNWTRGSAPRARIVHTYHGHVLEGYFSPPVSRTFIRLERLMARLSDAIVAISPAIREELLHLHRIGGEQQYRIIPLGFDLTPFAAIDERARLEARAALSIDPNVAVVTTVGRLTAIKQPQVFLETVAKLSATSPHMVALVAGGGELRQQLADVSRTLGIADRVRWLGWRRDLATVYGASDVFLLTSRNEGTPVALIEAMASAVPGVSTDVGGVRDVIESPDLGVVVPSGDVASLATGVERLLADATRRRQIGERARRHVIERYSLDRLVQNIAAMYRDLLDEG